MTDKKKLVFISYRSLQKDKNDFVCWSNTLVKTVLGNYSEVQESCHNNPRCTIKTH